MEQTRFIHYILKGLYLGIARSDAKGLNVEFLMTLMDIFRELGNPNVKLGEESQVGSQISLSSAHLRKASWCSSGRRAWKGPKMGFGGPYPLPQLSPF